MNRRYKVSLTDRIRETFDQLRRTGSRSEDALLADPDSVGSLSLGADGELIGMMFCTYCGKLTPVDAEECCNCGEYIADQGPDLQARLHRISRYANGNPAEGENLSHGSLSGDDAPHASEITILRPAEIRCVENNALPQRSSMASMVRARRRQQAESDLPKPSKNYTPLFLIGLIYVVMRRHR